MIGGLAGRPQKRVTAEFYRTESGNEPVREWLKTLSREDRQEIGVDVRKTENGWPIGMPTCDSLGDGSGRASKAFWKKKECWIRSMKLQSRK